MIWVDLSREYEEMYKVIIPKPKDLIKKNRHKLTTESGAMYNGCLIIPSESMIVVDWFGFYGLSTLYGLLKLKHISDCKSNSICCEWILY